MKKEKVFKSAFETYRTVRQIGTGGAGAVYEVVDSDTNHLALKLLDCSGVASTKLKRFKNEIHFCQREISPRVLRVLDYGTAGDGSPFYVMALYNGTLRSLIRNGIAPADVLPLFNQVLDGVEAAHLMGVCHRDIKPENLLHDTNTNTLIVADFGIARFREDDLHTVVNTGPQDRLANFAYAAPEQRTKGQQVDHRADVYALGLILNEMYTGTVPYGTGFIRISAKHPEFSYLDDLVDLMIQQQVEKRIASVAAIKDELISRGNKFVAEQRLDSLRKQVIPEAQIEDALIADPIRVTSAEGFTGDALIVKLNRQINQAWLNCFKNMGAYRYTTNFRPDWINIQGDIAYLPTDRNFAQQAVGYFKEYCETANRLYAEMVVNNHRKRLEEKRQQLEQQKRKEELNLEVLKTIRV